MQSTRNSPIHTPIQSPRLENRTQSSPDLKPSNITGPLNRANSSPREKEKSTESSPRTPKELRKDAESHTSGESKVVGKSNDWRRAKVGREMRNSMPSMPILDRGERQSMLVAKQMAKKEVEEKIESSIATTTNSTGQPAKVGTFVVQMGSPVDRQQLTDFIKSAGNKQILGKPISGAKGINTGYKLYAQAPSKFGRKPSKDLRTMGLVGLKHALHSAQMMTKDLERFLTFDNVNKKPDNTLVGNILEQRLPKQGNFVGGLPACEGGAVKVGKELGRGGFGAIHTATATNGENLVVKYMLVPDTAQPHELELMREAFDHEAEIHAHVGSHENIVALKGYSIDTDGARHMLLEAAGGGTLEDWINKGSGDHKLKEVFIRGALAGLVHLQDRGVMHRDFGAHNVLIGKDANGAPAAKIIDFGTAKKSLDERDKSQVSDAVHWLSPDLNDARAKFLDARAAIRDPAEKAKLQGPQYTNKGDVWGLGVLAYTLYAGKNPMQVGRLAEIDNFCSGLMKDHPEKNLISYLESQNPGMDMCKDFKMPLHVKKFIMAATEFTAKNRSDAKELSTLFKKPLTPNSV